jgi:hypothetical protein
VLAKGLIGQLGDQPIHVDAAVPDVDPGLPRQLRHLLAVGPGTVAGHFLLPCLGKVERLGSDHQAAHQPLEIPLERTAHRLVEVVDVEQQGPLRRGLEAEVEQVGVAAELHLQTRMIRPPQVGRHHHG